MKKILMMAVALMFCGSIVMAEGAKKEGKEAKKEVKKPEVMTVVGKVEIKKDEAGAITEISIVVAEGDKKAVVVDDKSKEVLGKLEGKEVEMKAVKGDGDKLVMKGAKEKGAEVKKEKKEEAKKEEPKKEEAAPAAPAAEKPAAM